MTTRKKLEIFTFALKEIQNSSFLRRALLSFLPSPSSEDNII